MVLEDKSIFKKGVVAYGKDALGALKVFLTDSDGVLQFSTVGGATEDKQDDEIALLTSIAANMASSPVSTVINVKVRVTHDGGASQAIVTTPALCEIVEVVVKCIEASATRTLTLGWTADPDALMTDAEVPHLLNGVQFQRFPVDGISAATAIMATVGGTGATGEWDIYIKIDGYT